MTAEGKNTLTKKNILVKAMRIWNIRNYLGSK